MTQEEALNILKMGHNVFLTGQAGSGKTHQKAYEKWTEKDGLSLKKELNAGAIRSRLEKLSLQ